MSARSPNVLDILSRYAAGYFPLYDLDDHFYWERLAIRAIIPVNAETAKRARRMGGRARKKFVVRHTTAVEEVIGFLQDPRVKPRTWVRSDVAAIYRALHGAGLLQTIEAFDARSGRLAGGLLGLVLPGTFIAETMFSLQGDASKVCLCELIENALEAGQEMIDVQTPHDLEELALDAPIPFAVESANKTPHPCLRLGERTVPLGVFLRLMRRGAERFGGTLADWVRVAGTLAAAGRAGGLGTVDPAQLRAAWPMLKNNFPGDVSGNRGQSP